jgi:hypothetical protein
MRSNRQKLNLFDAPFQLRLVLSAMLATDEPTKPRGDGGFTVFSLEIQKSAALGLSRRADEAPSRLIKTFE